MIDLALLREARELYTLQLQAKRQCQWPTAQELEIMCLSVLIHLVPDALDLLGVGAQAESSVSPPLELRVTDPCG